MAHSLSSSRVGLLASVVLAYNTRMFLLFHGSDEFSAREELTRLSAAPEFGYSQDTFAGAEGNLVAISQACETLPFLSERRLVIVAGLPRRKRAAKGGDDEGGGEGAGEGTAAAMEKANSKRRKGKAASNTLDA